MNLIEYFPQEIVSTDLVTITQNFSSKWKEDVVSLAERILVEYKKSGKERFVVVLGGPSGSSKSTTAAVLEILLNKVQLNVLTVILGQDGYHFQQEYLLKTFDENNESLASHKGGYDSFDIVNMRKDVNAFIQGKIVKFPTYSRKIHNPIEEAIIVKEGPHILIFEGLWLLYNKQPWNELLSLYDFTVFIHTPLDIQKKNTMSRHIQGKEHGKEEAEIFYEESDRKNGELLTSNIAPHSFDFHYS